MSAARCRMLFILDLCLNLAEAPMLLQSISSSCLLSLCLCAALQIFLYLRYLSRHQSLTLLLLKINNRDGMFTVAHFHKQPAKNNRLGVCTCDTKKRGKGRRRKAKWSVKKDRAKRIKSEMKGVIERENKRKSASCIQAHLLRLITPSPLHLTVLVHFYVPIMSDRKATLALLLCAL